MPDRLLRIEVGRATNSLIARLQGFEKWKYRFRVVQSPTNPDPSDWGQPYSLGASREELSVFRQGFATEGTLVSLGQKLAKAIFQNGQIESIYLSSLHCLRHKHQRLRIVFSFEDSIKALVGNVPWECLYHLVGSTDREHFGLSRELTVARFIPRTDVSPLQITQKLVVQVVLPNPHRCYPFLDVNAELSAMQYIAEQCHGAAEFHFLPNAEWTQLTLELAKVRPHVLIFAGHSSLFGKESRLAFQTADCRADHISASKIANEFRQHTGNLKLVVLSACETSTSDVDHPFSNAALALIEAGIPAVVAMQSKIMDVTAREFDVRFFSSLIQQRSLDECINAGRAAIVDVEREMSPGRGTQWAIPVLYLATREESVFDFSTSASVDPEVEVRRSIMEEKFPRVTKYYVDRKELLGRLEADFPGHGVTLVQGPFGSGKTELMSAFCCSKIFAVKNTDDDASDLFFYVKCNKEWATFDELLQELDTQGRKLGFEGFSAVFRQFDPSRQEQNVKHFVELLSQRRYVLVLDDYLWEGSSFWALLFQRAARHLRRSKIYLITSMEGFTGNVDAEYGFMKIGGFTPEEARTFLRGEKTIDLHSLEEMMATAATVDYLPWYLKVIKALDGETPPLRPFSDQKPLEYFGRVYEGLSRAEKEILQQLSILRKSITLKNIAAMVDPINSADYLRAAYTLQGKSLLTFARNLTVDLAERLKEFCGTRMSAQERMDCHGRAAAFYHLRSGVTLVN